MNIIKLNQDHLEAFKAYCYAYRYEHDESFLYDEDINNFKVSDQDPTYLLMDNEKIVGCISLIFDEYYLAGKKSRVRIFHCVEKNETHYKQLLNAVMPIEVDINKLEMFLPNKLVKTQAIIKNLDFTYYRTSYIMIRKNKPQLQTVFPDHYTLKPLRKNQDELAYAQVRNAAFKHIKGSETPINEEMVTKHLNEKDLLKDGMQILWYHEEPVGVVRMLEEKDETGEYSFVAPIALVPEHQGKGLGKQLLTAGIVIGQKNAYDDCMLVVNAENEKALSLYKSIGFQVDMAVSCFNLKL